jgi:hypothetical protein
MEIKFIIKVRFTSGTEKYVTGYNPEYANGRCLEWEFSKPAMIFNSFEYAYDLCRFLNTSHPLSILESACVVAINPADAAEYKNKSFEDIEEENCLRYKDLKQIVESYEA